MNDFKKATFAAGCFWGVEDIFMNTKGVIKTTVGYTGGNVPNPTYEAVCTDKTGHAEAVELEFDPSVVSYNQLLDIFWSLHDPTQLNRQGPDFGSQYRSAIFYHDDEQKAEAEASLDDLQKSGKFSKPVVTEVIKAGVFYPAEEYHQKYFQKHGGGSCHI